MHDEPSNPGRRYFTLRELLVVVTIIGLGFAVLAPAIRRARQESQRAQCTSNLKQIGLDIHNFHDIRQEICPSYITDDQTPAAMPNGFITWPLLLSPFVAQSNVYDLIDIAVPLDQQAAAPFDHAVVRGTVVPIWLCPSRRDVPSHPVAFAAGDYANVSLAELSDKAIRSEPRTWDAAMVVSRAFNATPTSTFPPFGIGGGFWPNALGAREYRSMTSFASVTDGISNTIFIGEKGVRQDHLGQDAAYLVNAALPSHQDGTFYYGRGGDPANLIAPGEMAFWSRRLVPARSGERLLPANARLENPDNRFGGWHEGVTLFLMGDGQVKALRNDTSTLVLQRLGSRNDGQKVDLP